MPHAVQDSMKHKLGPVMVPLMSQLDDIGEQLFKVCEMTRIIHGQRYTTMAIEYCNEVIQRIREEEELKMTNMTAAILDTTYYIIMDVD